MSSKKVRKANNMAKTIMIIIAGLVVLAVVAIIVWTININRRPDNKVFLDGTLPTQSLSGFYKGNAQSSGSWQGKKFEEPLGINVFTDGERYRFKTINTKSLTGNKQITKLDYNQSGNPIWLRFIVDEITQTNEGQYQGKVYLKFGPINVPVTYFQLSK